MILDKSGRAASHAGAMKVSGTKKGFLFLDIQSMVIIMAHRKGASDEDALDGVTGRMYSAAFF